MLLLLLLLELLELLLLLLFDDKLDKEDDDRDTDLGVSEDEEIDGYEFELLCNQLGKLVPAETLDGALIGPTNNPADDVAVVGVCVGEHEFLVRSTLVTVAVLVLLSAGSCRRLPAVWFCCSKAACSMQPDDD